MTSLRLTFLGAVMVLSGGCGLMGGGGGLMPSGVGGPKVPPVYGPYEVKGDFIKIGLGDREMRLQTTLDVPPDRGTVPVGIRAHGASFDAAAEQMNKAFADLKKIGGNTNCGFTIGHYAVPTTSDKIWKSGGAGAVTVDVAGQDPDNRISRANVCFKALREYIKAQPKYDTGTPAGFEISEATFGPNEIWSVESLEKHRDALVTLANERLKAVSKADAKMWDHADMQCTSAGVIQVISSNSHSVTLGLEMLCPVSPAETSSGPGKTRELAK